MEYKIDELLDELEELYSCEIKNRINFKSGLFELCCEIAEYEGIDPKKSYNYIKTLMENYTFEMYEDIKMQHELSPYSTFEIDFAFNDIHKIAWQGYLDRK